jgi:NAD-dependent dihydropyrimidine dehydrogenase PreA subunit
MAIQEVDQEKCIGCGQCVKACAVDVIRMDKEAKKAYLAYPQDCMMCELCLFYCPVDALVFTPEKKRDVIVSWG